MGRKLYTKTMENKQKDVTAIVGNTYLVVIGALLPLVMRDAYFDITETKYFFFAFSTLLFVMLMFVALLRESKLDISFLKNKGVLLYFLFLITAGISALLSDYRLEAFTGSLGRYRGVCEFILYLGVLFILFYTPKIYPATVYLIGASVFFCLSLGLLNCFYKDPLGAYEEIWDWDFEKFLSTLGQIDVYGEYCGILLAVLFTLFVLVEKLTLGQKLSWTGLYMLAVMALVANNSDTGHFAFVIAIFLSLFLVKSREQFVRICYALLIYGVALVGWELTRENIHSRSVQGINLLLSRCYWLVMAVVLVLFITGLMISARVSFKKLKKVYCITIISVGLIVFCYVVLANINPELPLYEDLRFNLEWGSGRGRLWSESLRLYAQLPWKEKLFGVGADNLLLLYNQTYIVAGFTYDSAHNCILQLLLGVGILGLLPWLGFVGYVYYKAMRSDKLVPTIGISFVVLSAYFVMSMIGIQICYTEVYAVIAAGLLLRS